MNQLQALRDTVAAAERADMPLDEGSDTGLNHLRTMLATVEAGQFSPTKLGRWLGWAQVRRGGGRGRADTGRHEGDQPGQP